MKSLKQNRAASFIVVALVYIFATIVGVVVYRALTLDWWLSLLIADDDSKFGYSFIASIDLLTLQQICSIILIIF